MVNDDDGIDLLIGAGVLVLVGVGVYKVLKTIGSYKAEQIVSTPRAGIISTYIPQSNINGYTLIALSVEEKQNNVSMNTTMAAIDA